LSSKFKYINLTNNKFIKREDLTIYYRKFTKEVKMAYEKNFDFSDETKIAWDLRRIWAEKIIGSTVQRIQFAMDGENYPVWFHLMKRDLRVEIFKNLDNTERKEVDDSIELTRNILARYSSAYLNKSRQPGEHEQIEKALCELYIVMTTLMEANGIFGKGYEYDEDEI